MINRIVGWLKGMFGIGVRTRSQGISNEPTYAQVERLIAAAKGEEYKPSLGTPMYYNRPTYAQFERLIASMGSSGSVDISGKADKAELESLAKKVEETNTALTKKLDNTATAADSKKLGGSASDEYAKKTDIPSRVRNDSDTSRIDGAGNLYKAKFIKGGYYILNQGGYTFRLNYTGPASWPGSYGYEREDRGVTLVYFSNDGSVVFSGTSVGPFDIVGANPENGDVLPDFSHGNSVLQFHKQVSEFPSEPSDRFALATSLDELAKKVDEANKALEEIA